MVNEEVKTCSLEELFEKNDMLLAESLIVKVVENDYTLLFQFHDCYLYPNVDGDDDEYYETYEVSIPSEQVINPIKVMNGKIIGLEFAEVEDEYFYYDDDDINGVTRSRWKMNVSKDDILSVTVKQNIVYK